ncbi:MAG: GyrI-like domain-containing protein [Bacteroidota bacterium]
MLIKEIKPINFLFFRVETTVQDLGRFLSIGQELFQEAVKNQLSITGPVHWHYFGFEGDPTKPFTLEIALPVAEVLEEYDGRFHFKRTTAFRCVSTMHEGNWLDMPKSYGKLLQFISKHQLKPTSANREIYVNADFKYPEANITEVQIGIA